MYIHTYIQASGLSKSLQTLTQTKRKAETCRVSTTL